MAKRSGPPPIVFILLLLGLLGAGYWFFFKNKQTQTANTVNSNTVDNTNKPDTTSTQKSPVSPVFPLPTTVAAGTTVRIDGSTSMVTINENLKRGFQSKFPNSSVVTKANGSEVGIKSLIGGTIDIAAISRPLSPQETAQGLTAVPVATDTIAIIIGIENPFNGNLTAAQVADIFQGKINNWSAVGGSPGTIRVINRPAISGTHQTFKKLVLKDGDFGTTSNVTTLAQDATTPLIRALGRDGISYATYMQVKNQSTARVLFVDKLLPNSPDYPYKRELFYVYKNPNPGVQAFLGYATSPLGQQAIVASGN